MRFSALIILAMLATVVPAAGQEIMLRGPATCDLVNGKIHTMDAQDRVVSEVTIQEGRFAYIGPLGNRKVNPCTKVIDCTGTSPFRA